MVQLPENEFFEGNGDCLYWRDDVYVMGMGYRNTGHDLRTMEKITGKKFVALKLVNERFYHLDTCLFILNERVAFYYPPAFDRASIDWLRANVAELVVVSREEAENFALNSFVHDQVVFMQKGNPETQKKLKEFGYQVVEVDVTEFMKAGGGIHCLTQVVSYS